MIVCGIDASTSIVGWSFSNDGSIIDAGFLNISKLKTNKQKILVVIDFLKKHPLIEKTNHLNLEAALSGFSSGFTSQKTIITLSRWNAIFEYVLSETFLFPINLINVNTARKKIFGKSRIKGIKPKIFVKQQLPIIVSNIKEFEKLNRNGDWDAHNSDMYDAVVASLFG